MWSQSWCLLSEGSRHVSRYHRSFCASHSQGIHEPWRCAQTTSPWSTLWPAPLAHLSTQKQLQIQMVLAHLASSACAQPISNSTFTCETFSPLQHLQEKVPAHRVRSGAQGWSQDLSSGTRMAIVCYALSHCSVTHIQLPSHCCLSWALSLSTLSSQSWPST